MKGNKESQREMKGKQRESKGNERGTKETQRETKDTKGNERETKYTMKMKEKQTVQRCQRRRARLHRPQVSGYKLNIVRLRCIEVSEL